MDYLIDNFVNQERSNILLLDSHYEKKTLKSSFGFIGMGIRKKDVVLYDSIGDKIVKVRLPSLALRLQKDVVTTLEDVVFEVIERY